MNGYLKSIREFSYDDVSLENDYRHVVIIDKETDSAVLEYREMTDGVMKLKNTYHIEGCAELLFKTIAEDFDR